LAGRWAREKEKDAANDTTRFVSPFMQGNGGGEKTADILIIAKVREKGEYLGVLKKDDYSLESVSKI